MPDEIVELLKNRKLRDVVVKTMESVCSYVGTLRDNPTDDMEGFEGDELLEEAWWRAEIYADADKIETAFDKHVMQKLPRPHRITLEEILSTFGSMAREPDLSADELDAIYPGFVNYVENELLKGHDSEAFELAFVSPAKGESIYTWALLHGLAMGLAMARKLNAPKVPGDDSEEVFWSRAGVRLQVYEGSIRGKSRIVGKIQGRMSPVAREKVRTEVRRILMPAVLSACVLDQPREFVAYLPSLAQIYRPTREFTRDWGYFIRAWLDAYYSDPTKKDSMDKRIRNAVHLMVESDAQSNSSVALSLRVTAVEALLGEGQGEISEKLSEMVATLLEPELSERNSARDFVKKLYKLRSDALHGKALEEEESAAIDARHLAAGVLAAIVARREFLRLSGFEPEKPQDLLKEIKATRYNEGQPGAVPDLNLTFLWKHRI